MLVKKILLTTGKKISKIFRFFKQQEENLSDSCENLISIPGIGEKNCNDFYIAL